jgi:hypothetical protein
MLLKRLDLVFCVDLTGSMGAFLQAARDHMVRILDSLHAELGDDLRVALVGYRDHTDPKLLEIQPFTTSLKQTKKTVDGLSATGGGDAPEAVYSGLDACLALPWRKGAYRVVVLVGDAPPHACGAHGDRYANGDPTGIDLDGMANRLEEEGVFVHALALTNDPILERAFRRLSISTGGTFRDTRTGESAMSIVEAVATKFLRDIELDTKLFALLEEGVEASEELSLAEVLAKRLRVGVDDVQGGMMRLRQRQLHAR